MPDDPPKGSAPDPHHSTPTSIPEGNVPRWVVLAIFGFFVFQLVLIVLSVLL